MGFHLSEEAFVRIEALRAKHGLSQGLMIEKLLVGLTDEDIDKALKAASANTALTKREAIRSISTMTDEEFAEVAQALAKARSEKATGG